MENDLNVIRTVYAECVTPVWDYYLEEKSIKYKPVVWIGESRQKPLYEKHGFVFHDRLDAINQRIALPDSNHSIDEDLLQDEILKKMYDRFSLDSITDENLIIRLNRWNFGLWHYLFETYDIQALIFPETPHIPYSYAGYLLAKRKGIKVIYTATLPLKGISYLVEDAMEYHYFKSGTYLKPGLAPEVQKIFLDKIINDYGFREQIKLKRPQSFNGFIFHCIKLIIKYFIFSRIYFNAQILKNKYQHLHASRYYYELLKRGFRKKSNHIGYDKHAISFINKNNKFKVVFALHYEPEMALLPLAGENYNQLKVIKELSQWLGDEGELYIKEHPWQFDYMKFSAFVRDSGFYKEVLDLKNTKFLALDYNIRQNIEEFDIIASITGTIGWEAFLLRKPVVVFSKPWYFGLPNICYFYHAPSVSNFLRKAEQNIDLIDYAKIWCELSKMPRFSIRTFFANDPDFHRDSLVVIKLFGDTVC